ncbi:MAG: hypothetical protein U1F14_01220 [Steroidobacteraceae bacterium]
MTIFRRILKPEVMRLIGEADAQYQLTQRERITLGALAQSEGMTARELATTAKRRVVMHLGPGSAVW